MDAIGLLIRLLVGLTLGGAIAVWGGMATMTGLFAAVAIAILTAVCGDEFLSWVMRACRFLR
jgi:hypothetical protein